jgi:uncharacterized membrane protein YhaH (DUF805 family)
MMLMSLRNLVKSQWWWVLVVVMWMIGIGSSAGSVQMVGEIGLITLLLTGFVILAKAVEHLTRPAQTARQEKEHTAHKRN